MKHTKKEDNLDKTIINLVKEKKPADVQQLVKLTKSEYMFVSQQEIMNHILQLQNQGKLNLKELKIPTAPQLSTYLKTIEATWYWIIIFLATGTALAVFTIPENSLPLAYMRNILGIIFILFLPGYSFIKLLFPKKELNPIERTALSIGMSLALSSMIGLILYYTPLGITTIPITLTLLALTTIFATAAIMREYQYKIKKEKAETETQT